MRLIDADALIKTLGIAETCSDCQYKNGPLCDKANYFVDTCEAIFEQPTIDPVKWIPVTERLPEKSGHYLITVVSDVTDGVPTVFTDDYFFHGWDDWGGDVVAWAIKPDPWRGEDDEEAQ